MSSRGQGVSPHMDLPLANWSSEVSEFTLQKEFTFAGSLTCFLEIVSSVSAEVTYQEIIESVARDVYNLDGEVKVSATGNELFAYFTFNGIKYEQTHLFVEISKKSLAHLTVHSKISNVEIEKLSQYIETLKIDMKYSSDTQDFDLLSFKLI